MRISKTLSIIFLILLLVPVLPCFLYSIPAEEFNANGDVCFTFKDGSQYFVKGSYMISSDNGNIYYYPDGQNAAKGGMADDNRFYNDDGTQANMLYYIHDKYPDYDNAETLVFDSDNEACQYFRYYQDVYADRQGQTYYYECSENNSIVKRSELLKKGGTIGPSYWDFIKEQAQKVDVSQSVKDIVIQTSNISFSSLDLDESYRFVGMTQAVTDKKGVCYHFAKIEKNILDELGIESEYVTGWYACDSHMWLRIWDEANGKWIYSDPACNRPIIDYKTYISDYIPCTTEIW